MYRCIQRVLERGGLGNRFVSIHNKDFPGNNSGGVTVGEAKVEAVMRRYMSVNNIYNPGAFSKGYRVTKKGFDSYMANSTKKLKKKPKLQQLLNNSNLMIIIPFLSKHLSSKHAIKTAAK